MSASQLVKNIFGSDSDSDEGDGGEDVDVDRATREPSKIARERLGGADASESDDDDDARANEKKGPALHLELLTRDDDGKNDETVGVAKLSNIFAVETEAFDAATFASDDADHIEREFNVVRWRFKKDSREVESNARVVTWSDGSRHLVIGDDALELQERDTGANEEAYLYVRQPGLMQAKQRLSKKITFKPATLESKTHERLTKAIDKKHGYRGSRTMAYATNVDPEKEKEQADAELEKAMRASAALARKQQKMMNEDRDRRYDASRPEAGYSENYYERRGGEDAKADAEERMDEDFLEADAEDEENDDDEEEEQEDASDASGGGDEGRKRRKRAFVASDSE